jgi:hypothetical protein
MEDKNNEHFLDPKIQGLQGLFDDLIDVIVKPGKKKLFITPKEIKKSIHFNNMVDAITEYSINQFDRLWNLRENGLDELNEKLKNLDFSSMNTKEIKQNFDILGLDDSAGFAFEMTKELPLFIIDCKKLITTPIIPNMKDSFTTVFKQDHYQRKFKGVIQHAINRVNKSYPNLNISENKAKGLDTKNLKSDLSPLDYLIFTGMGVQFVIEIVGIVIHYYYKQIKDVILVGGATILSGGALAAAFVAVILKNYAVLAFGILLAIVVLIVEILLEVRSIQNS